MIRLGDLTVFNQPADIALPGKLAKALAVISHNMHPRFAIEGLRSKTQCVLCALTVRDFLQDVGFTDARVLSVFFVIRAMRGDVPLHSAGIGVPDNPQRVPDKWNGHLVVVLPGCGWLIDPTLYQIQRPQWPVLPGMAAAPLLSKALLKAQELLAGLRLEKDDHRISAAWYARPKNGGWIGSPDTIGGRRASVVAAMAAQFGPWKDAAADMESELQ